MSKLLEEIKTPQESVNDDSVIIVEVFVKNRDKIKKNTLLAEIETSKAIIEIHSEKGGYVKCLCEKDQEVLIGKTLFEIYSEDFNSIDEKLEENKKIEKPSNHSKKDIPQDFTTKFSKEAEELILKNKISKDIFKNSEFISSDEVNKHLNPNQVSETNINSKKEILSFAKELMSNEQKLGKKKINEIMYLSNVNSTGLVSRLTVFINSSLEKIIENQNFISSTPLPLIAFEVSRLLLKYPNLNSFFHSEKIISHKDVNIGIAFDNGVNGLKVASIFKTNSLDLNSIEENISELSIKYNENKLTLQEMSSASFTITDLFSSEISNFHPLVNINNSAILGICGLNNGGFNIELSFDHRVSNGLEVSKFLYNLKDRLEVRYKENLTNLDKSNDFSCCSKCLREIEDNLDGEITFIKVVASKNESLICSNCLSGW
jgi:pyruvate/2-oxoglutarate dehydrogenase complex dihydrolipoamide acyltransferase (E2) component